MEVSRLGVKSELLPLAYATATATQDLSHVCDLHHSSQQCQIFNPLSKARDGTCILMEASQIRFCWATMGTLQFFKKLNFYNKFYKKLLIVDFNC